MLASFLLRFDFSIPLNEQHRLLIAILLGLPIKSAVFYALRVHRGLWKFAAAHDLMKLGIANVLASTVFTIATAEIVGRSFPRSIYCIDFLICFLLTTGARFFFRVYQELIRSETGRREGKNVLIYGAGVAGVMLLRDIRSNPKQGYTVVGFLDDDPRKKSDVVWGVQVLGTGRDGPVIVDRFRNSKRKIEEIIIAFPSATGREVREALANCRAAGVACKIIPGLGELLRGRVLSAQLRDASVHDLLGREPVRLDQERIRAEIGTRSILVTGAAGSIGSELSRQVASFNPERLILFDQAESDLFRIEMELRKRFPGLELVPAIGDICDAVRVEEVLRRYRIDSIFHAAAYKHVPMMEAHVLEAVKNNVIGTWNLALAAHRVNVSNFLMISSDKAVNPTSIMGLTKRVTELIVSSMAHTERPVGGKFVSVRFGNVLGSNGSVVPIFQQQIAEGGPVTVTHPEMRRYFMTIREAVQLVLQASTMGKASEIFVLDMGQPVRIADLASNMIRLAGLEPGEDIEIRFTGLRPGEKLFEELVLDGEDILPTYHQKIKIFKGQGVDHAEIKKWIRQLEEKLSKRDEAAVLDHLADIVPEYQRPAARSLAAGEQSPTERAVAASHG